MLVFGEDGVDAVAARDFDKGALVQVQRPPNRLRVAGPWRSLQNISAVGFHGLFKMVK